MNLYKNPKCETCGKSPTVERYYLGEKVFHCLSCNKPVQDCNCKALVASMIPKAKGQIEGFSLSKEYKKLKK